MNYFRVNRIVFKLTVCFNRVDTLSHIDKSLLDVFNELWSLNRKTSPGRLTPTFLEECSFYFILSYLITL